MGREMAASFSIAQVEMDTKWMPAGIQKRISEPKAASSGPLVK